MKTMLAKRPKFSDIEEPQSNFPFLCQTCWQPISEPIITQNTIFHIDNYCNQPEFYNVEKSLKQDLDKLKVDYFEKIKKVLEEKQTPDQIKKLTVEYKTKKLDIQSTLNTLREVANMENEE